MKRIELLMILLCCSSISGCALLDSLFSSDEDVARQATLEQTNNVEQDEINVENELEEISKRRLSAKNEQKKNKNQQSNTFKAAEKSKKTQYTGYAIVVPAPEFKGATSSDSWMSQFLQDSLTSQFAALSGMTVLDRKNEDVAIAEQKLQERGYNSFENAAEIGKITNARYVLAGSIQQLPSRYALTFRVNDIETNEVKAAFQGQYSAEKIENGKAVEDIILSLFEALSISIDESRLKSISNEGSTLKSTKALAQGMAAENNGELFDALLYLIDSSESGNEEAEVRFINALRSETPLSIKEKSEYYKKQIEKWNKIFSALKKYMQKNLAVLVYDFSTIGDDMYSSGNKTDITVRQGMKFFQNRQALLIYNKICDEWEKAYETAKNNNERWINSVTTSLNSIDYANYLYYEVCVGLYNKYGELLDKTSMGKRMVLNRYRNEAVSRQSRLFKENDFYNLKFNGIPIDYNYVAPLQVKIIETDVKYVYSYDEWINKEEE